MKDPLDDAGTKVDTRQAISVGLLLVTGLVLLVALRPSLFVTVALIVGLVLTVMLHEAGHFLVAKRSGMKVTEFFLGFGPRVWSLRRGETEYGVKALPLGGYVRIIGMNNVEEVDPADEARTYRAATFPKRFTTVLAGIAVNLLIALLLIFVVLLRVGQSTGPNTTIAALSSDAPAASAGFRAGDRIVAVGGQPVSRWDDIPRVVQAHAGDRIAFTVERDGATRTIAVTPVERSDTDHRGFVGISPGEARRSLGVPGAVGESFATLWRGTIAAGEGIGRIFSPTGVQQQVDTITRSGPHPRAPAGVDVQRPRSIIGIVSIGDKIVQGDVWTLLFLFATINLFLALFNLLPLLPFDGGHAAVAVYEAIASRLSGRDVRVDYRRLVPLTAAVLAVLVVFAGSTMFLDIREIITGS